MVLPYSPFPKPPLCVVTVRCQLQLLSLYRIGHYYSGAFEGGYRRFEFHRHIGAELVHRFKVEGRNDLSRGTRGKVSIAQEHIERV